MRSAYLESGVSSVLKHYASQWETGYKLVRRIDFNKFLEIGLTPLSRQLLISFTKIQTVVRVYIALSKL